MKSVPHYQRKTHLLPEIRSILTCSDSCKFDIISHCCHLCCKTSSKDRQLRSKCEFPGRGWRCSYFQKVKGENKQGLFCETKPLQKCSAIAGRGDVFKFCTSRTRTLSLWSFIKSILLVHNLFRLLLYRKVPWRPEGMWFFLFIPCIFLRVWMNWMEQTKLTYKTDNVLSVIAVVHSRLCEKPENRSWRRSQRFLDTRSRY